ncbi:hypothetical protein Plhal304r1_c070g0159361 [Plasmopara halstedii]
MIQMEASQVKRDEDERMPGAIESGSSTLSLATVEGGIPMHIDLLGHSPVR